MKSDNLSIGAVDEAEALHFAEFAGDMIDGNISVEFAPFQENRTFIDTGDPDYRDWKDGLKADRRREVDTREQYFHGYNMGTHNRDWRDNTWLRRCDGWYWCWAIADTLEMSKAQKERVCKLNDRYIDMRSFPSEKYGEQAKWKVVPFCICVLVHNENQRVKGDGTPDGRHYYYPGKENYPARQAFAGSVFRAYDADNDRYKVFSEFEESLPLSTDQIISCLEKVRRKIPEFCPKPEISMHRDDAVNRVIHAMLS